MAREVLSESLRAFIDEYVSSFLAWDIIVLFSHNPGLRGGVGEIAKFLGRNPDDLEEALGELVEKGLVKSAPLSTPTGEANGGQECLEKDCLYFYDITSELASRVTEFVKALDYREKRLAILTMLLGKSR